MEQTPDKHSEPVPAFDNGLSARRRFDRWRNSAAAAANAAVGRIRFFEIFVSCTGILLAYLLGMHVTGPLHAPSRWMGAMLACTSVVVVLQKGSYRDSLKAGWMRVVGTFIGALVAFVYLRLLPFSVAGMLGTVMVLEMLLMLFRIYQNGQMAVITLLIIMLVSRMSPDADPALNSMLRFFESAVGVGVGIGLLWIIERWNAWRKRLLHMGALPDGQSVDMDDMPLRWGHLRVLIASSMGQITGAALSTVVGVVIPLLQAAMHPQLSPLRQGMVAAASLAGIMAGSLVFGAMSDRRGYLRLFRLSPAIVLAAAVAAFFTDSTGWLAAWLFVMGAGIGGDYSLDGDYVSEIMPRRLRLLMVGVAKASAALGYILTAAACWLLLRRWSDAGEWSALFLLVALLAVASLLMRLRFVQSPAWLAAHGRIDEAERAVKRMLGQDVTIERLKSRQTGTAANRTTWRGLLRRGNIRKAMLGGIPWACEGMGVYGIGVFLPVLLMTAGADGGHMSALGRIGHSVGVSVYVDMFMAAGFAAGLAAINRLNHIKMQTWGFILAAAGLALLAMALWLHAPVWTAVAGFMIFELFINAGPHLITFVLPAQIYPVADRGAGSGMAAACGKAGAVAGVFIFLLLMHWGGAVLALCTTAAVLAAGAAVTAILGRRILPSHGWQPAPEQQNF